MADAVEAPIRYVVPGEKAIFYPADRERSYWPVEEHRVSIGNMRARAANLSLERNGFVLVREPSAVSDFHDPAQMRGVYYPEIEALARRLLGGEKVLVFGEVVRSDSQTTRDGRLPAYGAHVDYGERTIRQLTQDILGRDAADCNSD